MNDDSNNNNNNNNEDNANDEDLDNPNGILAEFDDRGNVIIIFLTNYQIVNSSIISNHLQVQQHRDICCSIHHHRSHRDCLLQFVRQWLASMCPMRNLFNYI